MPDNSGLCSDSHVQAILPIEVCMDKTKSSLFWKSHSWKSWILSSPWKCASFTHAWLWSYFQWELPGYTKRHKEPKTTKIHNKKVAITLETRQSLEDSPPDKPLGAAWTMFWACSAQIAFQASYSGMRKLTPWEDEWHYLYGQTHGYSLLLIFVTSAIAFFSVTLWWFQNLL